jgi:DNA-directed RNA polymerase subunit H (RpoH/RPB5)
MLSNRIGIKDEQKLPLTSKDQPIEIIDDTIFMIKTIVGKYYIKIIFLDVSSLKKQTEIVEFIDSYNKHNRIIIANSYSKTSITNIKEYNGLEIFTINQLLTDIIAHKSQPQFEILSDQEKQELLEERNWDKNSLAQLYYDDPVRHYFNLKVGDIIRCIRANAQSGKTPYYRMVVPTITPKRIFTK